MLDRDLSTVGKVLKLQVLVIILISTGFALAKDEWFALWSVLGGGTAFLPNLYFALRIRSSYGQDARKIVRAFYVGESGKLLLTAVLFIVILQLPDVKLLPLMTCYVSVLSIFWFALVMRENK